MPYLIVMVRYGRAARLLMADVAAKNQRLSMVRPESLQVRRSEVGTWVNPPAHMSLLLLFSVTTVTFANVRHSMWVTCDIIQLQACMCVHGGGQPLDAEDFDLGGSPIMLYMGLPACIDPDFPTMCHFSRAFFCPPPPVPISHSQSYPPFRYDPRRSTLQTLELK